MSDFWLIEEDVNEELLGQFTMNGSMEPIPNNTKLLAFIDEAKWDAFDGFEYISLRWNVIKPEEFKNRKIFQKLKVKEADPKKADKAKRMLMAIDHNSKAGLMATGQEPTTELMQNKLTNRPMVINVQVWEMNDKKGNWIVAVAPKNSGVPDKVIKVVVEEDPNELF
jgi:hypothetical protein